MWHRLLRFLRLRNDYDWSPPAWPSAVHPYRQDARSRCCSQCGGGKRHPVHKASVETASERFEKTFPDAAEWERRHPVHALNLQPSDSQRPHVESIPESPTVEEMSAA